MARSSVVKAEGRSLPSRQASASPLTEAQALDAIEKLSRLLGEQGGPWIYELLFLSESLADLVEMARNVPSGHVLVRSRRPGVMTLDYKRFAPAKDNVVPFVQPQVKRPRLGKKTPRALLPGGKP